MLSQPLGGVCTHTSVQFLCVFVFSLYTGSEMPVFSFPAKLIICILLEMCFCSISNLNSLEIPQSPLLPCLNALLWVCRHCMCVCLKENLVFYEWENRGVCGQCVFLQIVVWPVLCLLLSVQTICSFSLKPTRSMRVICQVKYCSFLLFHLTVLHWGYDNISATSCQPPSGHTALVWIIISNWILQKLTQKSGDFIMTHFTSDENLFWLFGVDLVKMKSPPSVYALSFRHACSYIYYCHIHIFVRNMSF